MQRLSTLGNSDIQSNQWKYPICALFLLLSILVSFVLFQLLSSFNVDNLPAIGYSISSKKGEFNFFSNTYIIIYPICLFAGSIISGYLCQPYVKKTIAYLFLSSGLYMIAFIAPLEIITSSKLLLKFLINPGTLWVASSLGGVYLGRYIGCVSRRGQIGKP